MLVLATICAAFTACNRTEPIRINDKVDKRPEAPAAVDRMLTAFTLDQNRAWFFKMTGPKEEIAEQEAEFRKLIESVTFSSDKSIPQWSLPGGWQEEVKPNIGPDDIRVATLKVGGNEKIEVTVTRMGAPPKLNNAFLIANVNRWRRQMTRPRITTFELEDHIERFDVGEKEFVLAGIAGRYTSGSMAPPFAAPQAPAGPPADDGIGFDLPEGWRKAANTSISRLAFEVVDGDKQIKITVTPVGGNLLDNINRWCDEIKHKRLTLEQLGERVKTIKVGEYEGQLVELVGPPNAEPRETILGARILTRGATWFIKLDGDWQLAERERDRFVAFVESLRF